MKKKNIDEFVKQSDELNEIMGHFFEKYDWSAAEAIGWASVLLGSTMANTDINGEDIAVIFEKVFCVYAAKSPIVGDDENFSCKIDALMKHLGENA